ncbi:F-box/RNI-like superfamily protein, partial [Striga asiatica]
ESLEELHLRKCTLSPVESVLFKSLRTLTLQELQLRKCTLSPVESVLFKSLRTLTLEWVDVDGGTFETKTLGCPLLRRLVINNCWELRNTKEVAPRGLNYFVFKNFKGIKGRSIKIDIPSLERVRIEGNDAHGDGATAKAHSSSLGSLVCICTDSSCQISRSTYYRLTARDLVSPVKSVRFKGLRTFTLKQVQVDGVTFETIMLGCPLLRRLVIKRCWGLRNVRLSEVPPSGLKYFELFGSKRIEGPWRHKGPTTRPNLDTTQQNFDSIVDRILQGYSDQNLSIHKLHLHLSTPLSPPVISLLNKWLPMITALNIKVLKLNFQSLTCNCLPTPAYYESLEELHLRNIIKLSPVRSVPFKRLRTLTLEHVQVDDGTFEMIMLGCPLLSRLVINYCSELRNCKGMINVRLSEEASRGLNYFLPRAVFLAESLEELHLCYCKLSPVEGVRFKRLRTLTLEEVQVDDDGTVEKITSGCPLLSRLVINNSWEPWRHKGSTRPNLGSTQQNFVSVLDRTLQGYLDQNLSIHKLHLHFSTTPLSPPVISLLNKWIPMITALNIKVLKFNFHSPTCNLSPTPAYYESLEELHLCKCRLSPVKSVRFKFLHTLTLEQVKVDGATFETKTLGCPLLRRLVLHY